MTIEAMKLALDALEFLELETFVELDKSLNVGPTHGRKAIIALRAAIEQAEKQEPVAFNHEIGSGRFKVVPGAFWWHVLIGDSPTKHGKFSSRASAEKMAANLLREFRNGAFVQHTKSRQWQGLTDGERKSIREWQRIQEELGPVWAPMMLYLYEAIEAKLKEKNG